MARPTKNYCDYFPHDANMRNHRKVKAIRSKFGINGYALWSMVIEYLTGSDGNVFPYTDMEFELMAGDFGVTATEIRDVIDYCISLELLFNKDGFVSSETLDERLAPVYEKRGKAKESSKKQIRENGKFAANNTDITVVTVTEIPQKKVNKIKSKESKSITTSAIAEIARIKKLPFEEKTVEFKKFVFTSGGMLYTKRMLEEFHGYWSETNAENTRMRWEDARNKYFLITRRLSNWASKNDKSYPCRLTEAQKTIKQRQHEFAISMESFKEKYDSDTMNSFYKYWSQPENVPEPSRIRWQTEEFWDLSQRLSQWVTRNVQTKKVA